ncbi:LPS export ABC transporter periplasmic protein LptC [Synechococcus sp. PCC 6717]|nr:LPS export ABC transporter periplasmic protein LptC [Synechococcus sp. PCC 6717]
MPLLRLVLLGSLAGCGWVDAWIGDEPTPEPEVTGAVRLQNLTLQQTDDQGQILWLLQADGARYSDGGLQQIEIDNLRGDLRVAGKPTYTLEAKAVKVRQRNDQLWIEGRTTVTDVAARGTIVADQFVWRGDRALLQAQKNLQIRYPQVAITAQRLEADSQRQELRALRAVQVTSSLPEAQDLRLSTDVLVWQQEQERLLAGVGGAGGVTVVGVAGDRLRAQEAEWSIPQQQVALRRSVQVDLQEPRLLARGELIQWRIDRQQIISDAPLTVEYPSQGITGQARRGVLFLDDNRAIFENARLQSQPQAAQLRAQRLTWRIPQQQVEASGHVEIQRPNATLRTAQLVWRMPQQEVEAQGGVFYHQANPRIQVRGQQAKGWLDRQEVIVTGRVQTQVPVQLRLP